MLAVYLVAILWAAPLSWSVCTLTYQRRDPGSILGDVK
jgi:hypothetical protein